MDHHHVSYPSRARKLGKIPCQHAVLWSLWFIPGIVGDGLSVAHGTCLGQAGPAVQAGVLLQLLPRQQQSQTSYFIDG